MRWAKVARLAAVPAVLAVGLGALAIAQGPGRFTTYAGRSDLDTALTVAAGLALGAARLVPSFSRRTAHIGDLAMLAGLIWFAPVWVGWDKGLPLVRTLGMLVAGLTFPLLLPLVVAYPGGPLSGGPGLPAPAGGFSGPPSTTSTAGPTAPTTGFSSTRSPASRGGSR